MSGRINGGRTRMLDLEAARRTSRRLKPSTLTPDEASILIDSVFLRYGMDPTLWTDLSGWRHIMIGSAEGFAGVVEWQPDDHYLIVLAPLLDIPEDSEQLLDFYRLLLDLNYHAMLSAHFSINENTLYLGISRPIRSLDEEEVDEAIRTVMVLADSYDDRLKEMLELLPPSLPKLPDIKMRPEDAKITGATLAACDSHGQSIFRFLIEQWERLGHAVEVGTSGIALVFHLEDQPYALAALHPGFAERRQEIILGWEGLRRKSEFSNEKIDKFQASISRISPFMVTANTAHIEVKEAFDQEDAEALLQSMDDFAREAIEEIEFRQIVHWDPQLPAIDIGMHTLTLSCVQETLRDCDPRVQRIFAQLMQGWFDAGGQVACDTSGRIYLRFKTAEHEHDRYGPISPRFNLAVLVAADGDRLPRIELAWNLASGQFAYLDYVPQDVWRFESTLTNLPGFTDHEIKRSIIMAESFQEEHGLELLHALLELKAASEN